MKSFTTWLLNRVTVLGYCIARIRSCLRKSTPASDWLTIRQAADVANVTERTIRNWIRRTVDGKPILTGVIISGRIIRIPRAALYPLRKAAKATRPIRSERGYACDQCGRRMSSLPPPEFIDEMKPKLLCPICLSGVQFDNPILGE